MPRQCIATRQPAPGLERELAAVEQEEEVAAQVSAAAAAQARE